MNRASWERWRTLGPGRAPLAAVLIAASVALYLLFLLVSWHRRGGMTEPEEWLVFLQGWTLVPALALAATALIQARLARARGDSAPRLWRLACALAAALLVAVAGLRASAGHAAWMGAAVAFACLAPPAVTVALLAARERSDAGSVERLVRIALVLWACLILTATLSGPPTLAPLAVLSVGVLAALLLVARRRGERSTWLRAAVDGLALLAIPLLVFDPRIPFDVVHFSWFLGPVNAIAQGRTILVEAFSPYGVLLLEFLARVLGTAAFPFSYTGFALLIAVLSILQIAAAYLLLRFLLRSQAAAIVAVLVALAIDGIGEIAKYPSSGPVRFLLPWLLPLLVVLRTWAPRAGAATRVAQGVVLGIASLWETQTFLAAIAAWMGVLAGEAVFASRLRRGWLSSLLRSALWGALCVVVVHVVFALRVRSVAGSWPQWRHFFDLVRSFSPAGEGWALFLAPPWGGWIGIVLVYVISLVACVHAAPLVSAPRGTARLTIVLSSTLMGIAQLTYYVGLSLYVRLYAVALPAIVVGAFWLERLLERATLRSPATQRTAAVSLLVCALLVASPLEAPLRTWLGATSLLALLGAEGPPGACAPLRACLDRPAVHPATMPALALIEKHAARAQRLAVFLDSGATTEVLMRARRAHAFPMTDAAHDSLLESNVAWIESSPHGLRAGDVIFSDRRLMSQRAKPSRGYVIRGTPLLQRLQNRVCREFRCVPIEQIGPVTAMLLEDLSPAGDVGSDHADDEPEARSRSRPVTGPGKQP